MPLFNDSKIISNTQLHPGFLTGKYYFYSPYVVDYITNNTVLSPNTIVYFPLFIGSTTKIDRLSILASNSSSSGKVRLGIYSNESSLPSQLILDAGEINSFGSGYKEASFNPCLLNSGWYWLAASCSVANTIACSYNFAFTHFVGSNSPSYNGCIGYKNNFNYAPFPSNAPIDNLVKEEEKGQFLHSSRGETP
ncbi:hypothetical protein NIES4075_72260 [Tolypothrix sp. NIES-4075]|uniref:hypothetical protein n=1 Tax=Tolypothrix sp. NIES-4075 TaxID=2005459 RepID=UPI000B5CDF87|nr:hypothetical protein [Tolypothrix sp. NIES-4075]GAX46205.1 hypothetical protein NIES4075_72260 [Tolypothrix sp. NIES-4075]